MNDSPPACVCLVTYIRVNRLPKTLDCILAKMVRFSIVAEQRCLKPIVRLLYEQPKHLGLSP